MILTNTSINHSIITKWNIPVYPTSTSSRFKLSGVFNMTCVIIPCHIFTWNQNCQSTWYWLTVVHSFCAVVGHTALKWRYLIPGIYFRFLSESLPDRFFMSRPYSNNLCFCLSRSLKLHFEYDVYWNHVNALSRDLTRTSHNQMGVWHDLKFEAQFKFQI